MFKLFAELIAFHLDGIKRMASTQATLVDERENSEQREQFIAVLGHDLRNPLAAISAGARVLLRSPLDPNATKIIGLIQNSVSRMSDMIDNVLDFARGRLGGGFALGGDTNESLEPILGQVVAELRTVSPDRTIQTQFMLTRSVKCDGTRIAQLLSNLIGNALTHGAPDTPVCVRASTEGGAFELSVSNTGNPIPQAAMERLFHPFARGDMQPGQKGLGLGLYIASEIARAHGGTLSVVSSPQETRFTFRMPLES